MRTIYKISLASLTTIALTSGAVMTLAPTDLEVYFAPWDDITPKIVQELNRADKTIHCSLYGLTNDVIAQELVKKDKQGVKVVVGEDKLQSQGRYDLHEYLQENGVDVIIKKTSALEHNKWCIIDGQVVIEGSYNYSQNAQKQDNSFLIIRSRSVADKFENNFTKIIERDTRHSDNSLKVEKEPTSISSNFNP